MSYQLTVLNSTTAIPYSDLTYPRLQSFLGQLDDKSGWVALGAHQQDEPVGLALAYVGLSADETLSGMLHSIFVIPEERQQGIGTALLRAIETTLAIQGCHDLSLEYLQNRPTTPFLEKMLHQQDWPEPKMNGFIVHSPDVSRAAPLFDRVLQRSLPEGYSLFLWKDLSEADLAELRQDLADEPVEGFDPFIEEATIEPLNSVGLRYRDRIIGWMITHRLAPDLIRYTTLYVRPERQPLSRSLVLMLQAVKLQAETDNVPRVIFNVNHQLTPAMHRWVERRFAHWCDPIRHRFAVTKILQTSSSEGKSRSDNASKSETSYSVTR